MELILLTGESGIILGFSKPRHHHWLRRNVNIILSSLYLTGWCSVLDLVSCPLLEKGIQLTHFTSESPHQAFPCC